MGNQSISVSVENYCNEKIIEKELEIKKLRRIALRDLLLTASIYILEATALGHSLSLGSSISIIGGAIVIVCLEFINWRSSPSPKEVVRFAKSVKKEIPLLRKVQEVLKKVIEKYNSEETIEIYKYMELVDIIDTAINDSYNALKELEGPIENSNSCIDSLSDELIRKLSKISNK